MSGIPHNSKWIRMYVIHLQQLVASIKEAHTALILIHWSLVTSVNVPQYYLCRQMVVTVVVNGRAP